MRHYKPVEIARELGISTSALRHYETWGWAPVPERSPSGYRLYTPVHLAYFRFLRAMFAGFGMKVTSEASRLIQAGDMNSAFWLINKEQAALHQEKTVADHTLSLLQNPTLLPIHPQKMKNHLNIGEAAALTGVQSSAIRHWEKEGLIKPDRDPENGYRIFNSVHIRQIMLIRTLRRTVYFLDHMKEVVHAVEHQSLDKAKKVAEEALASIHERSRRQFDGVYYMVELCKELGLMDRTLPKPQYGKDPLPE